jgi:hypothetical protein
MHIGSSAATANAAKREVLMRGGLITHISSWMLGFAAMLGTAASAAPASGEPGAEATDQIPPRTLPLRLLEGVNIHATLVTEMLAQQGGNPQGPLTMEDDWNVTVEAGGKIKWNYGPTVRTRRGTQSGAKIASTSDLDKASRTANGDAMWQFSDGALTFLRSYAGGAIKVVIALGQDGQSLTCSASNVFAREREKKDFTINSPIDSTPVTILSWKQVSSNCDVTSPLTGFDGFWLTTVSCEKKGDVLAYSYKFIGRVKNAIYHAEVGEGGNPGWATYDGTIERDGTVGIIVKGLTGGDSRYTAGHIAPGKHWSAQYAGRFDEARGSALRIVDRTCHAEFVKQ